MKKYAIQFLNDNKGKNNAQGKALLILTSKSAFSAGGLEGAKRAVNQEIRELPERIREIVLERQKAKTL